MEGLGKVGAFFIACFIVIGIIYKLFANIGEAVGLNAGQAGLLFVVALIAIIVTWIAISKHRQQKKFEAAPVDGPMKVNIETSRVEKLPLSAQGIINRIWHRLHINVVMSQNDMVALKQSGLEMHSLFRYPHPKWPEQETDYLNCHLFNTPYVDFPDIQSLEYAKDQLIEGLHALRSRLKQQKDHTLEQRSPAGQKESFEI